MIWQQTHQITHQDAGYSYENLPLTLHSALRASLWISCLAGCTSSHRSSGIPTLTCFVFFRFCSKTSLAYVHYSLPRANSQCSFTCTISLAFIFLVPLDEVGCGDASIMDWFGHLWSNCLVGQPKLTCFVVVCLCCWTGWFLCNTTTWLEGVCRTG